MTISLEPGPVPRRVVPYPPIAKDTPQTTTVNPNPNAATLHKSCSHFGFLRNVSRTYHNHAGDEPRLQDVNNSFAVKIITKVVLRHVPDSPLDGYREANPAQAG